MKYCVTCGEPLRPGVSICPKCKSTITETIENETKDVDYIEQRIREHNESLHKEKKLGEEIIQKKQTGRENILKINDLFEYDCVSITDEGNGKISVQKLKKELESHANSGWRLVCTMTNELGHNVSKSGYGGISSGTNATIDQNILIFERCLYRYTT